MVNRQLEHLLSMIYTVVRDWLSHKHLPLPSLSGFGSGGVA